MSSFSSPSPPPHREGEGEEGGRKGGREEGIDGKEMKGEKTRESDGEGEEGERERERGEVE